MSDDTPPIWALECAVRCWCDPETKHSVMDPPLAHAFARRLAAEREACAQVAHKCARRCRALEEYEAEDAAKIIEERIRARGEEQP